MAARAALDIALVSLNKVKPIVKNLWYSAKSTIAQTRAKPIVSNILVTKSESALDRLSEMFEYKLRELRQRQLQKEVENLEKKLDEAKRRRNSGDGDKSASKAVIPRIGTAWQYAKVEMIPPMTDSIVNGPLGKNFENSVGSFGKGIVSGIQGRIKEMELEVERVKREKEAAIKAAVDKAAAVAKAAQKAIADAKKKKDAEKAKEAEKPKEEKKPDAKAAAPKAAASPAAKPAAKKAKPAKKKEPARKKEPKKHRRDDKKGKAPKK